MASQRNAAVHTGGRHDARCKGQATMREALVAAVPPLLFGLMLSVALLVATAPNRVVIGGPTPYGTCVRRLRDAGLTGSPLCLVGLVGAPLLAGMVVFAGALVGARRRLPLWSYTWACGAWVGVVSLLQVLGEDRPYLISPVVDIAIVLGLLALQGVLTLIAALRGRSDAALVGMGFAAPFAVMVCSAASAAPFRRVDVALLAAPAGLASAALIFAFLRVRRGVRWVSLGLLAVLDVALILVYSSALSVSGRWPLEPMRSFQRAVLLITLAGLVGPVILSSVLGKWRARVAA